MTEEDVRQSRAHYHAYAEQLDAQVGRLLEALEASGQAGNTMVVFTTDGALTLNNRASTQKLLIG